MTLSDPKRFYSRFLTGHHGKLHFAAHSHHFWPDVSRDAHVEYWDDCSRTSDEKWDKVFSEVIPRAQQHVASILNLKGQEQIVFAPNTHELATRLLSLFLGKKKLHILTTESEFHSWRRQVLRLKELPEINLEFVATQNILEGRRDFIQTIKEKLKKGPDIFYISQVFFDSGLALTDSELMELSQATPEATIMVVDGYHGFAAIPTDLSSLEGKIFYLAGGYKYAQAGEGAAFMVVPKGKWRPANTGWFAEFGELSRPAGKEIGYREDGLAFIGSTQDSSGLYRLNAVWDLFKSENIAVSDIHAYIKKNQELFLENLPPEFLKSHSLRPEFKLPLDWHGHFLTFESPSEEMAAATQIALKSEQVLIDRRGRRLRFGFGLYQDQQDILKLTRCLKKVAEIPD